MRLYSAFVMAASLSSGDKGTVERTLNELLNQDCKSVHLWHDHELENTVCMQVAVMLIVKGC